MPALVTTGLQTPVPNIPLKDAVDQLWALGTVDNGDGTQSVKVAVAAAVPLTLTDRSSALVATVAETMAAANPARRYLFIQPQGADIWISFVGTAAPSALGSFLVTSSQTYEISGVVPGGAVSVYSASSINCTAYEG